MTIQLSALEIHHLIKELKILIDGKVDKIFQPEKNEILIQFHIPNTGKKILRVSIPNFFYLTEYKPNQEKPSNFCLYLRKKLGNARLRNIEQKGFERVIYLDFESKEKKHTLIFELFSKGNIILTENNKILSATDYQEWKDRKIAPGEEYIFPKREFNFLKLEEKDIKEILIRSNRQNIVKSIAMDLGLGGKVAEKVCELAKIDKNSLPKDFKNIKKLHEALQEIKKLKPYNEEEFKLFNEFLDKKLTTEIKEKEDIENPKITKIKRIITAQEETIKKMKLKELEERKKAEFIYNNYQKLQSLIKEPESKDNMIKDINKKEKSITVELE